MKKLIIVGSGQLGEQVAHYAVLSGEYEVVGFLNDFEPKGTKVCQYEIIGKVSDIEQLYTLKVFDYAFIAIGYDHFDFKEKVYKELKQKNIPLGTIVAPNVYIDHTAKIGQGCILYPGSVIDKEAILKDCSLININANIAHNTIVGEHTFIAGGATLCGFTKIGAKCFIGVNSVVNEHIEICDNVRVGSGTAIRENINKSGVYMSFYKTVKIG